MHKATIRILPLLFFAFTSTIVAAEQRHNTSIKLYSEYKQALSRFINSDKAGDKNSHTLLRLPTNVQDKTNAETDDTDSTTDELSPREKDLQLYLKIAAEDLNIVEYTTDDQSSRKPVLGRPRSHIQVVDSKRRSGGPHCIL
jgi:hypothetical protein